MTDPFDQLPVSHASRIAAAVVTWLAGDTDLAAWAAGGVHRLPDSEVSFPDNVWPVIYVTVESIRPDVQLSDTVLDVVQIRLDTLWRDERVELLDGDKGAETIRSAIWFRLAANDTLEGIWPAGAGRPQGEPLTRGVVRELTADSLANIAGSAAEREAMEEVNALAAMGGDPSEVARLFASIRTTGRHLSMLYTYEVKLDRSTGQPAGFGTTWT